MTIENPKGNITSDTTGNHTEKPRPNEARTRNQYVMELARDLVFNLERLPKGQKLTLEVTSIGNDLFNGIVRSTDPDKKVFIGQGTGFRLRKEKAS